MKKPQPSHRIKGRRPRGAIAERLVNNLLNYAQRFLERHGLRTVTIWAQLHEGLVVKVAHATCMQLPPPGPAASGRENNNALAQQEAHRRSHSRSLALDELNARIVLRLNRLLRHFEIGFGALNIKVKDGAIETIEPSPLLRPAELRKLALLLGEMPRQEVRHRHAAAGGVGVKPDIRRPLHLHGGRRGNARSSYMS